MVNVTLSSLRHEIPHNSAVGSFIKDYSRLHELPFNAVVLSTGDPNLSGLGKYAGPEDLVIPGISSL